VVSLVELGTHRPMAAVIAGPGESEMAMARRLIHLLPNDSLLLADRLYGVGKFLVAFLKLFSDGRNRAQQPIVLTDGAAYNRSITETHFPKAINIIDLYHAREHLHELVNLLGYEDHAGI